MDFSSVLGWSGLPAKVHTKFIHTWRVKLRKSTKERKFSGNRWKELKKISSGAGKQEENEATVAEKDDVLWCGEGKNSEKLEPGSWLGDTWPEYLPVFLLPIMAVARSTGAIHSLDVHTCHEAESKRVAMETLNWTERRPPIMETFDSSASVVITGISFTSDSLRMNVSWKLQPGASRVYRLWTTWMVDVYGKVLTVMEFLLIFYIYLSSLKLQCVEVEQNKDYFLEDRIIFLKKYIDIII